MISKGGVKLNEAKSCKMKKKHTFFWGRRA